MGYYQATQQAITAVRLKQVKRGFVAYILVKNI